MNRRTALFSALGAAAAAAQRGPQSLRRITGVKPRNIVFILTDDHR
jgi:hypothetical protein